MGFENMNRLKMSTRMIIALLGWLVIMGLCRVVGSAPTPRTPAPAPPPPPPPPPPVAAKSAVVALQWPMGLCKTTPCEKAEKLPGNRFTLHGVWPVQADGSQISYCPGKDKFSYSDKFRYQWEKHGTCSELEFSDYFERSLDLAKKHSPRLFRALGQSGTLHTTCIYIIHFIRVIYVDWLN